MRTKVIIFLITLVLIALLLFVLYSRPQVTQVVYSASQQEAIIDNILTRRAIRQYKPEQVPTEKLDIILKSAIYAPSATDAQPWEIRAIQNPQILKEINERYVKQARIDKPDNENLRALDYSIFYNAPTLIVIAVNKDSATRSMDAGTLLQNVLLSAHALGFGSTPLSGLAADLNQDRNKDLLKLLNIPENYEVAIGVALGYPNEAPVAKMKHADRVQIIK